MTRKSLTTVEDDEEEEEVDIDVDVNIGNLEVHSGLELDSNVYEDDIDEYI